MRKKGAIWYSFTFGAPFFFVVVILKLASDTEFFLGTTAHAGRSNFMWRHHHWHVFLSHWGFSWQEVHAEFCIKEETTKWQDSGRRDGWWTWDKLSSFLYLMIKKNQLFQTYFTFLAKVLLTLWPIMRSCPGTIVIPQVTCPFFKSEMDKEVQGGQRLGIWILRNTHVKIANGSYGLIEEVYYTRKVACNLTK